MTPNAPGFFSDPKNYLAFIAIVLTVLNLGWTLANQFEQNRRWSKLNAASIELSDPKFQVFVQKPSSELDLGSFGYVVKCYASPTQVGDIEIIHTLRARDAQKGTEITGLGTQYTLSGLQHALSVRNITGAVKITRVYKAILTIKNEGKTDALNVMPYVESSYDGSAFSPTSFPGFPSRMQPNSVRHLTSEIERDLNVDMPTKIDFRLRLAFDDVSGEHISRNTSVSWFSDYNRWGNE